jgi:hypothetical protein
MGNTYDGQISPLGYIRDALITALFSGTREDVCGMALPVAVSHHDDL